MKTTAPRKQITQWSFSRWDTWNTCAFKAYCKYILKLPDPSGEAALRGTEVGDSIESWLAGKIPRMPAELGSLKDDGKRIKKLQPLVQLEWALDKDWKPTGWFAPNCWVRIKTDIIAHNKKEKLLEVHDGKTGRIKDVHQVQLSLYAIGGFEHYPEYTTVRTNLLYYDHPKDAQPPPRVYVREELPRLKDEWLGRVSFMLKDRVFTPKKNNGCKYCPYSKTKGGPCEIA